MKRIFTTFAICMVCLGAFAQSQDKIFTVKDVTFTMKYVKGGTYMMGFTSEQIHGVANEKPAHKVTVSDFYIGEVEVTQALWVAVMDSAPSYKGGWTDEFGRGDDYPAYRISWTDALKFIKRLNELTGSTFRLPTEAEWEYAARGGNKSSGYRYSGSNNIDEVSWYDGNSAEMTHPVKLKKPNELGIYDMSGNVWEWCLDWYETYSSEYQKDPKGPSKGTYHIDRGGAWNRNNKYSRVTARCYDDPGLRNKNLGFRLALVP